MKNMKGQNKNIKTFKIHVLELNDGVMLVEAMSNKRQNKSKIHYQTAPVKMQRSQEPPPKRQSKVYREMKSGNTCTVSNKSRSKHRTTKSCFPMVPKYRTEKHHNLRLNKVINKGNMTDEWCQVSSPPVKQFRNNHGSKSCKRNCCKKITGSTTSVSKSKKNISATSAGKKSTSRHKKHHKHAELRKNKKPASMIFYETCEYDRLTSKQNVNKTIRRNPSKRFSEQMKQRYTDESDESTDDTYTMYKLDRRNNRQYTSNKEISPRRQQFLNSCTPKQNILDNDNQVFKQKPSVKCFEPLNNRFLDRKENDSNEYFRTMTCADKPEKKVTFADTCTYRTIDSSVYPVQWLNQQNHPLEEKLGQISSTATNSPTGKNSPCSLNDRTNEYMVHVSNKSLLSNEQLSSSSSEQNADISDIGMNNQQTLEEHYDREEFKNNNFQCMNNKYNADTDDTRAADSYDYQTDNDCTTTEDSYETCDGDKVERVEKQLYASTISNYESSLEQKRSSTKREECIPIGIDQQQTDVTPDWMLTRRTVMDWISGDTHVFVAETPLTPMNKNEGDVPEDETRPRKMFGARRDRNQGGTMANLQVKNNYTSPSTPEYGSTQKVTFGSLQKRPYGSKLVFGSTQKVTFGSNQNIPFESPHRQESGLSHKVDNVPPDKVAFGSNVPPDKEAFGSPNKVSYVPPDKVRLGSPNKVSYVPPDKVGFESPNKVSYVPTDNVGFESPNKVSYVPPDKVRLGSPNKVSYVPPDKVGFESPNKVSYVPTDKVGFESPNKVSYVPTDKVGFESPNKVSYVPPHKGKYSSSPKVDYSYSSVHHGNTFLPAINRYKNFLANRSLAKLEECSENYASFKYKL
ncbi:hypothetical protein M8J75_004755 [Diaphorina citri]|nr:hypothetical protein M8J75_004755 [Diaphorina citri]